jgi:selenocysteine lyase/cysteine desulfurase
LLLFSFSCSKNPYNHVVISRRSLLAAPLLAAAFRVDSVSLLEAAVRGAGNRSPEDLAADEDFWFEAQNAFTVDRSYINLNNGGVSPSPRIVQESMKRYLDYSNQAPVYHMWQILEPQVESVRRRLAATFGCDTEEIAITRNASESLENVILGMDLKPGDEVLTTLQDYPRMITAFKQRERRDKIVLKQFPIPTPPGNLEELTRLFEKNITPRTKVMLVSQVTFSSGQFFPVRDICRLGRSRGIEVIVDGAHAFAQFPFTRDDLDCDYYGTSLHKWLMAPHGTGMLYVRKNKIPQIWPLMAAGDTQDNDIRKFEEIGTHPAANHNAIADALTFHEGIGVARKAARLRYLKLRWATRLKQLKGARMYTSLDPAQSCGIGVIGFEGVPAGKLAGHLFTKHRIIVTTIDYDSVHGMRITPSVYTTLREVDTFCDAMEKAIREGIPA